MRLQSNKRGANGSDDEEEDDDGEEEDDEDEDDAMTARDTQTVCMTSVSHRVFNKTMLTTLVQACEENGPRGHNMNYWYVVASFIPLLCRC